MQITNLKQRVKEYFNKGDEIILKFQRNEKEFCAVLTKKGKNCLQKKKKSRPLQMKIQKQFLSKEAVKK